MLHPRDEESLCALLRVSEVPEKVVAEYDIRQRMYHSGGGTGPLGIGLLIGVLRHVGVALPEREVPVEVDWRKHLGEPVLVLYGDQKKSGKVMGLVDGGNLVVLLDGVDGEVELPRHCVSLVGAGPKKAKKAS